MAYYTLPANDKTGTRTPNYKFTVDSKDDADLQALKENIARQNKEVRAGVRAGTKKLYNYFDQPYGWSIRRVRLMARGPRRVMQAYIEEGTETIRMGWKRPHGNADCCLQHSYATHFDVYVEDNMWAMQVLQTELDTGQTASQQAAVRKATTEAVLAETAVWQKLREEHGIVVYNTPNGREFRTVQSCIDEMRERGVSEEIISRMYPESR